MSESELNRKAGGFKAAIHNPNVSEEGKQEAARKLKELEESRGQHKKNEANVIGGYKAALKNPHVSQEAKEHAQEELKKHGVDIFEATSTVEASESESPGGD